MPGHNVVEGACFFAAFIAIAASAEACTLIHRLGLDPPRAQSVYVPVVCDRYWVAAQAVATSAVGGAVGVESDEEVVFTAIFEIKNDKYAQIHIAIGGVFHHIEKVELLVCSNTHICTDAKKPAVSLRVVGSLDRLSIAKCDGGAEVDEQTSAYVGLVGAVRLELEVTAKGEGIGEFDRNLVLFTVAIGGVALISHNAAGVLKLHAGCYLVSSAVASAATATMAMFFACLVGQGGFGGCQDGPEAGQDETTRYNHHTKPNFLVFVFAKHS